MRRGAALPGRATEQLAGSGRDSLALAGGPPPEPSWSPSAAGAVHRNTVGGPARALGAVARRCGGRPCLRQRVSVLGQRPVSGVSVQHHACLSTRPLSNVSTAWATRTRLDVRGDPRWWRPGVRSEVATTLRGHPVRPRPESPGRCEPSGVDCDLRVRPWCGRSMQ
jgi:hypothetical protein